MTMSARTRLQKLFSFHGRTSRLGFWRTFLFLQFATAVVFSLSAFATMAAGWAGAVPALLLAPLLVANVAVVVRRLHDRGKSAWWTLLFNAAPWALMGVAEALVRISGEIAGAMLAAPPLLVALILTGLGWVEIGLLKGQPAPNRYGAPA